jgi:hypothetical protein
MKRTYHILILLLVLLAVHAIAQTKDKDKKEQKPKPIPVYLGNTNLDDGKISVSEFNKLVKQGLTSKDSLGRPYTVNGFLLTYAERNLYEDSVGKLMWVTDFLSEICYGDSLSTFLKQNITERSKAGDTVYFDQISVISPEGKGVHGKGMRFALTK